MVMGAPEFCQFVRNDVFQEVDNTRGREAPVLEWLNRRGVLHLWNGRDVSGGWKADIICSGSTRHEMQM